MQNIKLDTTQAGLARELLEVMAGNLKVIVVQFNDEHCLGINKYDGIIIEYLLLNDLIISHGMQVIDKENVIRFFTLTDIGYVLSTCSHLSLIWNKGIDSVEEFIEFGFHIYSVLKKYDEPTTDKLVKLLSFEERNAYQNYCKTQIRCSGNTLGTERCGYTSDSYSQSPLSSMFEMSVLLGVNGTDEKRTNNYVFKKCMEELGEMALEDQIETGLSYKEAGSDGVAGEAVDLAICAMDMFALQHPGLDAHEIEEKFIKYMNKKLQKWRTIVGK